MKICLGKSWTLWFLCLVEKVMEILFTYWIQIWWNFWWVSWWLWMPILCSRMLMRFWLDNFWPLFCILSIMKLWKMNSKIICRDVLRVWTCSMEKINSSKTEKKWCLTTLKLISRNTEMNIIFWKISLWYFMPLELVIYKMMRLWNYMSYYRLISSRDYCRKMETISTI